MGRDGKEKKRSHYSGLRPTKGWPARNYKFFRHRIFPQLFREPAGVSQSPLKDPPARGTVRITWIGHASFYLEFHDRKLLIDPIWGTWLGFIKRQTRPGLLLEDMPAADLILVSHAHADHLNRSTLRKLQSHQGVLLPRKSGRFVAGLGHEPITEMTVWEEWEEERSDQKKGIRIIHTPSHHWGARFGPDTHRDYGGFVVQYDGISVYHAGDTAYFSGFKEIQERLDTPLDVALLPIGAYEAPSGRNVHMTPEEAIQAFADLKAQLAIPMHYDTFPLGNEAPGEATDRFAQQAKKAGVSAQTRILSPGVAYDYACQGGGKVD